MLQLGPSLCRAVPVRELSFTDGTVSITSVDNMPSSFNVYVFSIHYGARLG